MKSESESLIPHDGSKRVAAEGNCVAETPRGGEQPEAEEQSRSDTKLNSIRHAAMASLLATGEACRASGDADLPRELPMAESAIAGCGWSGNVPKVTCDKWRDPQGRLRPAGSQSVHSSGEAGQRRWSEGTQEGECVKRAGMETKAPILPARAKTDAGASKEAEPSRSVEGMLVALVRGVVTEACACPVYSESASCPPVMRMKAPTGEPDAGNPPVRFGGRGGA
jgi:hypothetical protein